MGVEGQYIIIFFLYMTWVYPKRWLAAAKKYTLFSKIAWNSYPIHGPRGPRLCMKKVGLPFPVDFCLVMTEDIATNTWKIGKIYLFIYFAMRKYYHGLYKFVYSPWYYKVTSKSDEDIGLYRRSTLHPGPRKARWYLGTGQGCWQYEPDKVRKTIESQV